MTTDHTTWEPQVPASTRGLIRGWLAPFDCLVLISRSRVSKYGDFTPARRGRRPVITVNGDLTPFRFMLTLTHEIAHLITWRNHGRRVRPHGAQWKRTFGEMLSALAAVDELPDILRRALSDHAKNPKSTASYDPELHRVLRTLEGDDSPSLDDLEIGQEFIFRGRRFRKLTSDRTRCVCLDLGVSRKYRISKAVAVELIESA